MKNLLLTVLCSFFMTVLASAQRVIEKNIDYNHEFIHVEIPFASDIELKTWNKKDIYFKATLSTEEGKYLDLYELHVDQSQGRIDIVSKAEALFKKYQQDYKKQYANKERGEGGDYTYSGDVIVHDGLEYKFHYTIYIPENAEFKISSINGNLTSEIINGDFTADFINGNIRIERFSGDMNLKTINGEIDIPVGTSDLTAETIHGNIYAAENLELSSTERMVGQKIESKNKRGEYTLQLSTINGNMYLR